MGVSVNMIVAACEGWGIGKNGALPWTLKREMKYFAKMTTETEDPAKKNAVIMGRKTYESIPPKFRPLKNRLNVVLTRQKDYAGGSGDDLVVCSDFSEALSRLEARAADLETLWVIGGTSLYYDAILRGICRKIYLTKIHQEFECDVFFPPLDSASSGFREVPPGEGGRDPRLPEGEQEEEGVRYTYCLYQKAGDSN